MRNARRYRVIAGPTWVNHGKAGRRVLGEYFQADFVIVFICDKLKLLLDGNLFRCDNIHRGCNYWTNRTLCTSMGGSVHNLAPRSQHQVLAKKEEK